MPFMTRELLEDTQALVDDTREPSRRSAIKAAIGMGYVAAAGPVMSQTAIKTPADGLITGEVMVDVNGFKMPAFRSAPAGKTGLPVVLVVSEIFGVHEYIADVTRRLARQGYLAIAPELFVRQGDPGSYGEAARINAELISRVPDDQVIGDLDACMAWAQSNGGDVSRLAISGFCWGGRIVWLYAAHQPRLKAAVAWYGRLQGAVTPNTPKHPLEVTGQLKAPVLGLYGGADAGIPIDSVEQMKRALTQGSPAARASEFVVYPDTPHAFHADYRATYRQGPAEDGWQRLQSWFRRHGVA